MNYSRASWGRALVLLVSIISLLLALNLREVHGDELPPLYIRYMLPAIYNELVPPDFPPCPTPEPGEPIVC